MDVRKLDKIEKEIEGLRRGQAKARDLESVAQRLGRRPFNKTGKEPTYLNTTFKDLRPLSIPHHGGKDIPIGTKNCILNQLEEDVAKWREWIDTQNGLEISH